MIQPTGDTYKASKSRLLRFLMSNVYTALFIHWCFQNMLAMDYTELGWKLTTDLVFTGLFFSVLQVWLSPVAALVLGWLLAHTANLVLNGHVYCVLKSFGRVRLERKDYDAYLDGITQRIQAEPSLSWAAAYGSLVRGELKNTSDLDIRVIRLPGLRHAWRACWFVMLERSRAHLKRFPLDILLLDSPRLLKRIRVDEPPLVLYDIAVHKMAG